MALYRGHCPIRLKLLLGLFVLCLIYIFILNSAVPYRTTTELYGLRRTSFNVTVSSTSSHDDAVLQRLSSPVDFDISILNFNNVSDYGAQVTSQISFNKSPICPDLNEIKTYKQHLTQATLLIEDLQEDEVLRAWRSRGPDNNILPGGHWKPKDCLARNKIAVIIPYRDRRSHLNRLLDFLFPILQTQLLDFRFIVTEQYGDDLFNKGRIMNAAFRLAQKLDVDCVIFHDVDMFPQDDRTPYDCPRSGPLQHSGANVRHLGAFVSNLGYQLWYEEIVGGVLVMRMNDYLAVNGYSNLYFGWGGEDDDMGKRILSQNITIERPPQYARYSMLKHLKRKRTAPKLIYKLLDSASTRWAHDGVNETGLWNVMSVNVLTARDAQYNNICRYLKRFSNPQTFYPPLPVT